jgi:hypothetical protein
MILYTPIGIPKLQINDWTEWWDVWNNNTDFINKVSTNHNQTNRDSLKGFDLYHDGDPIKYSLYKAVMAPKCNVIDNLIEQIFEHVPLVPKLIRVMENTRVIGAHSDYSSPRDEFRAVLWNTYDEPLWEFSYINEKRKLELPEDTNSFYYKDYPLTHSAIHNNDKTKGLLLVYGYLKENHNDLIQESAKKYKDFAWVI